MTVSIPLKTNSLNTLEKYEPQTKKRDYEQATKDTITHPHNVEDEQQTKGTSVSGGETVPKEEDPLHTRQWLFQIIEVEQDLAYCLQSIEAHEAALQVIVSDTRNSVHEGDIGVHVTTLPKEAAFDFESVHHLPTPPIVEQHALVLEVVYKEGTAKCFVRVKADLVTLDGVTALHAAFNLLEYLETGVISAYPFTKSNTLPPSDVQFENFSKQMKRIEDAKQDIQSDPIHEKGIWRRSPLMYEFEDTFTERKGLRFTEVNLPFKQILERIDVAKEALGIELYAITVNFSPATAVSLCPTMAEVLDKDKKLANITLPPVGTGAPAPMNEGHVETLFNTIFLNNYNRHEPRISGKVVGYLWDWSGIMKTFPPFFHLITIQGKLFFSMSGSPPDMIEMEKLFNETVGVSETFQNLPQHVVNSY
jgi:hypothetical protein